MKLTESGAVYQPAAFAARLGAAVTCGSVASYLSGRAPASLFPALSRHEPLTEAAEASGPEYVLAASQLATPDVASVAAKLTAIGAMYQPVGPAALAGVAEVKGAVASYLSPKEALRTFPAWSVQLPDVAAVALSGPE